MRSLVLALCLFHLPRSSAFVSRWDTRRPTTHVFTGKPTTPPPPPPFTAKPLPIILAGGLFLFGSSVKKTDREFADELLSLAQVALQADPAVTMEFGQGIETGGVYASMKTTTSSGTDQLVLQFQIEGGNAWAQGVAYGIRERSDSTELVSLEVANMDWSINGTPLEVAIPLSVREMDAQTD